MEERLQKILAKAGYGSRRACEELILAKRVSVNGRVAEIGQKADPRQETITVDGRPVVAAETPVYIALNKPKNVLSDAQEFDTRQSARDLVPIEGHLFPVGRLDYDSEGLLLLTNDGELANRLTHPRYRHEKEYRVLVATRPDDKQLAAWRRGVVMEDGSRTLPARVEFESTAGDGAWLTVVLREGRKRQIREVGKTIGLPVSRIIRTRIGTLLLGNLKPGQWRNLNRHEVDELKRSAMGEKPFREYKPHVTSKKPGPENRPTASKKRAGQVTRPAGLRKITKLK